MANKVYEIELHVKDPDAFQEFYGELSAAGKKYFEFGEYATIGLSVEVVDGKPTIKKAEFVK